MDNLEEAVRFFKQNHYYKRLFIKIKHKYESLDDMKGNVILENPSKEEKQAISGLMKKDYSKNKSISINLNKLQQIIDRSKFSGVILKEILDCYFDENIISKKKMRSQYDVKLKSFFEKILKMQENSYIYEYLKKMIKEKNELYIFIKKEYSADAKEIENALRNTFEAINSLPNIKTRLPMFASQITKNPHGLDKTNLTGKLFIYFLCYIQNNSKPKNSEELAEFYYKNNLLIDDVSNMVLCKNIYACVSDNSGNCIPHEGWYGFANKNEPHFATLYNLANIVKIQKEYNYVLVVENPTVFMQIKEKCEIPDFPMVCTYGQVKIAGIVLLNLLVQNDMKIYYSGDIDPEGLQIADKLKQRYKENLELIGLNIEEYKRNMSNIPISKIRLQILKNIKSKELQPICKILELNKKASYEEMNIEGLIKKIQNMKKG